MTGMNWEAQRTSFGGNATTYNQHRPDWPALTAAWLTGTEDLALGAEALASSTEGLAPATENGRGEPLDVLDLGAGTGKLTATLVAAGHRVTAADPSEGMLAVLAAELPEVRTVVTPAERLALPDAQFDVVTVAQAWHWFDHEAAAAECARVLRPGGLLAIAWHLRPLGDAGWLDELQELTREPAYQRELTVQARTNLTLPPPFENLERTTFEYDFRVTPAGLAAVASTWSYVALREDRDQVLADIEELGQRVADESGTVVLPHVTHCYRARTPKDLG